MSKSVPRIVLLCTSLFILQACGGGGGAPGSSTSSYTLSIDNGDQGTLIISNLDDNSNSQCDPGQQCSLDYPDGTRLSISSQPNLKYRLQQWSGDCSGNSLCALTMDTDRLITAQYEQLSSAELACIETTPPPTIPDIGWQTVVTGLSSPVQVTHAGDNSGRLFIVEQGGTVRSVNNSTLNSTPFLDITDRVYNTGNTLEDISGLLSLAFHPQFASNHLFYVYYISRPSSAMTGGQCSPGIDPCILIAEFDASALNSDGTPGILAERVLMEIRGGAIRNSGHLMFGVESSQLLYISVSDTNDGNYGFDQNALQAKLLRINVNAQDIGLAYAVPTQNPAQLAGYFSNAFDLGSSRHEIFAYGFRNPWRFSIDPLNGNLYLGDNSAYFEEINLIDQALFYGWSGCEGNNTAGGLGSTPCDNFDGSGNPAGSTAYQTIPIKFLNSPPSTGQSNDEEYFNGPVYRGVQHANLCGTLLYADFNNGDVMGLRYSNTSRTVTEQRQIGNLPGIVSFGEDEFLEVYAVSYSAGTLSQLQVP